jgi:hypothetical protein
MPTTAPMHLSPAPFDAHQSSVVWLLA